MKHNVFVYGTLRHGQGNWARALKDKAKLIGFANTPGDIYHLGGFPGVILPTTDDRAAGNMVYGEVYEVDDSTLKALDRLESEGSMYHRRTIQVSCIKLTQDYDSDSEAPTMVYIYEYSRIPNRNSLITTGDWLAQHKKDYA